MAQNSSNSSGVGNTKSTPQISPSKRWCFTLNNYSQTELDDLVPKIQESCNKWILAKEIGENGTPHIQGFFEFKTKKRPIGYFNNIRIHYEKARACDLDQVVYCSKEGKVFEKHGMPNIPRPLQLITPDRPYQIEILSLLSTEPDNRKIYWYFGNGNIGKTQFSKYLSYHHNAICLSGKGSDVRNGVIQYLQANGDTPEIVIFPVPKSYDTNYISYEALENIKDMYFYSGKYEGGMVNGNSPHLLVFANCEPDYNKVMLDRWKVFKIKDDYTTEAIII